MTPTTTALSFASQPPPQFELYLCLCTAGATGGVAAATVLLTEVLPAALGGSLEDFAAAMEASDDVAVAAEAAELRWARLSVCDV